MKILKGRISSSELHVKSQEILHNESKFKRVVKPEIINQIKRTMKDHHGVVPF